MLSCATLYVPKITNWNKKITKQLERKPASGYGNKGEFQKGKHYQVKYHKSQFNRNVFVMYYIVYRNVLYITKNYTI